MIAWEATAFVAHTPRGQYAIERDTWHGGYDLRFTASLRGWPQSQTIPICPPANDEGKSEWATLAEAMAAAAHHYAQYEVQEKRAAGGGL